jgi:hypothetical protein
VVNADALTVWLSDHPTASNLAPDLVALARSLASAVDDAPDNPALSREYRLTLSALREIGADDGDGQEELANALRSPVRNRKKS